MCQRRNVGVRTALDRDQPQAARRGPALAMALGMARSQFII